MKIFKAEPLRRYHSDSAHPGFLDRLFCKVEPEGDGFNRRMFEEDFARIFNYADRHRGRLFDISSNDEELTKRLLSNVHTGYGSHLADEAVCEWVEDIAQSLVWFGVVHYSLKDVAESGDIHIASFGSSGVVHLFGTQIQWVPRRTERH
ncbi:hypothetical protein [Kaistia nematophila]|uniref:Uncharacterized protein n=1 Tax=Kaistia nematophila TaxID=2994654 RepID=A0A9X3DZT8_9HYPH|nr:hypothetical protein [Kaistia nematophila]MCX5569004.1 hypothetical protein [Kaistia nematophila]